jgi:hypothetical protein
MGKYKYRHIAHPTLVGGHAFACTSQKIATLLVYKEVI